MAKISNHYITFYKFLFFRRPGGEAKDKEVTESLLNNIYHFYVDISPQPKVICIFVGPTFDKHLNTNIFACCISRR